MAMEIVSSRIVAPIIGASIFTWTAVIGTTLMGLTLGSLLGGALADKYHKIYGQKVLAFAFLASSVLVCLVSPLSKNIDFILDGSFHVQTLVTLVSATLFLLPSLAIGTISPIIFKLYLSNVDSVGKKYGLLSGLWSLGSIVGVFVTGFYFVSVIGSSGTVYIIALTLLAPFFFFYIKNIDRHAQDFPRHVAFMLVVFLVFLVFVNIAQKPNRMLSKVIFHTETAYYDVKVVDYDLFPQFGSNRILFLDIDPNSIRTKESSRLFYTDIYPAFSVFSSSLAKIHVIGAGAYTLPINLRKYYPKAEISVSEIDPEIEKVGRTYFDLDTYNIKTEIGDARLKFSSRTSQAERYDLIYGDAYNSFVSVPWHLLTKEFILDVRHRLNPNGIYAINFIGSREGPQSKMFDSVYKTMKEVFPNSYIFAFGSDPSVAQSITIVGVNNEVVLSYDVLRSKLDAVDDTHFLSSIAQNSDRFGSGRDSAAILTDDFAPVEYMMTELMSGYLLEYLTLYRKILS